VKKNILLLLILIACQSMLCDIRAQIVSGDFQHAQSVINSISAPTRIAVDHNDNVIVVDSYNHSIRKFDPAGNLISTITSCTNPLSVGVNSQNVIFIGNASDGTIQKLNADGSLSLFYTGCKFPNSLTFSPNDHLFIADSKLHCVVELDETGNLVQTIGQGTLVYPTGIAYDSKNDRIIVGEHGAITDNLQTRIYLYNADGSLFTIIGMYGNSDGKFYRIQGITTGRCNNIYVCDPYLGSISVFTENGQFVTRFGQFGTTAGNLNVPMDIAFDSQNRIWLASMNNDALEVFTITDQSPSATISSEHFSVCDGSTVSIPVLLSGVSPWSLTYALNNSNPLTIQNITSNPYLLNVGQAGSYTITGVSDAIQTGTCLSGKAMVDVIPAPTAVLQNTTQTLCAGHKINIPVYFTGTGPWTFEYTNGTFSQSVQTNSNPYFLEITETGLYSLTSLSDSHCSGTSLNGIADITVNPVPVSDYTWIQQNLKVTFFNHSQNAVSYFWDFGDNQYSSAGSPLHAYQSPGTYKVTLSAMNNGCIAKTKIQWVSVSATQDTAAVMNSEYEKSGIQSANIQDADVFIYPNPSDGMFTMVSTNDFNRPSKAEVLDAAGRVVWRRTQMNPDYSATGQKLTEILDLTSLPGGIYTLKLQYPETIRTVKLVINN